MIEEFINNNLIQPIFFGFGLVTIILIQFKRMMKINTQKLIESSIIIIKYSGIIFFLIWCFYLIKDETLLNRFKGKYWFSGWFLMFTYPFLSQLFWIKKIKNSDILVYLVSILFLVFNLILSGKIICFDGDFDLNSYLIEILKEIGIYVTIVLSVTYLFKLNNQTKNQ